MKLLLTSKLDRIVQLDESNVGIKCASIVAFVNMGVCGWNAVRKSNV